MSDRNSHRHLAIVAAGSCPDAPERAGVDEGELLLVGDIAKAVGKTVRAIHLYEELGLVRAHERSKGRYRLFAQTDRVRPLPPHLIASIRN